MVGPRQPWRIVFTKQAQRDARKLARSGLRQKAEEPFEILRANPRQSPPPFEKLTGDLSGACSRRINILHRVVYRILDEEKTVTILRMWARRG